MSFDLHAHTDVAQDLMPARQGPLGDQCHSTPRDQHTAQMHITSLPPSFPHNLLTHSSLPPSLMLKSRLLLGLRVRHILPPSSHATSPSLHTYSILAGSLPTFCPAISFFSFQAQHTSLSDSASHAKLSACSCRNAFPFHSAGYAA